MLSRLLTLVLLLCVVGTITGCILIPIPHRSSGDIYLIEDDIEDLIDKSATKSEVIEKLGIPLKYGKTSMSYWACREPGGFGLFIISYGAFDYSEVTGSIECFEVVVEFDGHNHLSGYKRTPFSYVEFTREGREKLLETIRLMAESGNPDAQWDLYDRHGRRSEDIMWLCRAADNSYFQALIEVGNLYWRGQHMGIEKDLTRAYVWYTMAAKEGGNDWDVWELVAVKNEITARELAKANDMLAKWKPGQCERDLAEAWPEMNK
jgi:hypothetical protein